MKFAMLIDWQNLILFFWYILSGFSFSNKFSLSV